MSFQLFSVQRNTKCEARFHPNMGSLTTRVTYIQKAFLGVPYKTLHKYRETYHGAIKDCSDCRLSKL